MTAPPILQQITDNDVFKCDNADRGSYSGLKETFNKWVADGTTVMHVLRDDGVYRHLVFSSPESLDGFELITWPGALTISGGHGTWTFKRTYDMFTFFHGAINVSYWAEKLDNGPTGGRSTAQEHDPMKFKQWLLEDFWAFSRDHEDSTEVRQSWESICEAIAGESAFMDIEDPNDCIEAMMRFSGAAAPYFQDCYEADWNSYDWHFEFSLASILAGIRTYRAWEQQKDVRARRRLCRGAAGRYTRKTRKARP